MALLYLLESVFAASIKIILHHKVPLSFWLFVKSSAALSVLGFVVCCLKVLLFCGGAVRNSHAFHLFRHPLKC